VVWLDTATWQRRGQFGVTDRRGDDTAHLDGPTAVAVRGARAVVADAGNQRVLKLVLRP
jgi:hypothetical protein